MTLVLILYDIIHIHTLQVLFASQNILLEVIKFVMCEDDYICIDIYYKRATARIELSGQGIDNLFLKEGDIMCWVT